MAALVQKSVDLRQTLLSLVQQSEAAAVNRSDEVEAWRRVGTLLAEARQKLWSASLSDSEAEESEDEGVEEDAPPPRFVGRDVTATNVTPEPRNPFPSC